MAVEISVLKRMKFQDKIRFKFDLFYKKSIVHNYHDIEQNEGGAELSCAAGSSWAPWKKFSYRFHPSPSLSRLFLKMMRRRLFRARPLAIVVVCFVMLVGDLTCYYKHPMSVGYSRPRNSRTQPSPSAVQKQKANFNHRRADGNKKTGIEKIKSSIGVREKKCTFEKHLEQMTEK